jgi:hypothetical protein
MLPRELDRRPRERATEVQNKTRLNSTAEKSGTRDEEKDEIGVHCVIFNRLNNRKTSALLAFNMISNKNQESAMGRLDPMIFNMIVTGSDLTLRERPREWARAGVEHARCWQTAARRLLGAAKETYTYEHDFRFETTEPLFALSNFSSWAHGTGALE